MEQRYLYLVHDPRYVNKLRSLIPTSSSTPPAPTPTLPATTPTSSGSLSPPPPEPSVPEPPRTTSKSKLLHIDYLLDVQTESEAVRSGHDGDDAGMRSGSGDSHHHHANEEEEERDPNLYDTFVSPLSLQAAFRAAGAVCIVPSNSTTI